MVVVLQFIFHFKCPNLVSFERFCRSSYKTLIVKVKLDSRQKLLYHSIKAKTISDEDGIKKIFLENTVVRWNLACDKEELTFEPILHFKEQFHLIGRFPLLQISLSAISKSSKA